MRGRGGPGDEHELFDERWEWEQELGRDSWIGLGWPAEYGGRGATLVEQVIFYEEYARAGGPGRVGIIGEGLLGPTIVHFGTRRRRSGAFLPGILQRHRDLVPGLLRARRGLRPRQRADARRARRRRVGASRPEGVDVARALGAVDLRARAAPTATRRSTRASRTCSCRWTSPGIEIRPIVQITGHSEFNETFFDGARTAADNVVGEVDGGWRVAMGTLAFERGASTLGQQLAFENELRDDHRARARERRSPTDPVVRQRLADAWITLRVMRFHALRTLPDARARHDRRPATSIHKLFWATFHRGLGELAVDVLGAPAIAAGDDDRLHAPVPLLPRRHDLRRLEPDPAQRHRRAGARACRRSRR